MSELALYGADDLAQRRCETRAIKLLRAAFALLQPLSQQSTPKPCVFIDAMLRREGSKRVDHERALLRNLITELQLQRDAFASPGGRLWPH